MLDQLVTAYDKLNNPIDEVLVWSKEIVDLDADNKAGLKINYQVRIVLAEAEKLAQDESLPRRSRSSARAWRFPASAASRSRTSA